MKKHLLLLFAALLPMLASAQTTVEIDGIWYNIIKKAKQAEVIYKRSGEYSGSITIPATVTYEGVDYRVTCIGGGAFCDCSSLTAITIPAGVTSIGSCAFQYCSSLTSITLPEGVTSIGNQAFYDCSSLTAINIPVGVTSIKEYAFGGCSSLTTITIPVGVTSIEEYAFGGCSSLTAINIPESVTSIGYRVFYGCYSLTTITIPESVTSIGSLAFYGCSSLTDVYCYAEEVPTTETNAFNNSNIKNATLHVPANTLNAYKTTAPWSNFGKFETLATTILVEGITLSQSLATLIEGGTLTLTATVTPDDATNKAVTWSSSNTSVATVDANGKVTAKAAGTATITATANDGSGVKASCVVTVEKKVMAVSSITLSQSSATLTEGETLSLTATVKPTNATNKGITWSSSNTSVATVDANGKVTAKVAGTATITATANDGSGAKASCKVTVEKKVILVSQIILSQTSAILTEGETLTLTATVTPDNADNTTISWSSSNEDIAMVSSKGKVVAMGVGTATITATANDGSGVSASCEVTVNELILGKCATPTISYEDGKILLTCDTEGAIIKSITTEDCAGEREEGVFNITPTYTITAYATMAQYEDSDVATVTLCWIACTEEHEDEEEAGILTIPAKAVLISTQGGTITVSGLADGTEVTVYSTAGALLATAESADGTATLNTDLTAGNIAVVKIGEHSIKVAIK